MAPYYSVKTPISFSINSQMPALRKMYVNVSYHLSGGCWKSIVSGKSGRSGRARLSGWTDRSRLALQRLHSYINTNVKRKLSHGWPSF